jgi:hypothetical protein
MSVRPRQGPKLVVCAKTNDSEDCRSEAGSSVRGRSDVRKVEKMLRDLEQRALEMLG